MPEVASAPQAAPAAPPKAAPKRFELPPEAPATPAPPEQPAAATPPAEGDDKSAQNTEEQAPSTAPEGEKPETDQDPEKKSSRRFERRLDRAYRKAAEAAAERDLLRKELEKYRQQASPGPDPQAPKLENFKDIEEYAAAKAKYESEKAVKAFQQQHQTAAQRQAQQRLVEGWEARVAAAESKYEDFDVVVGEITPTTPWAIAIMEADNGPDIAHYLGKNLKEAERIAALPPAAQIRAIGRLEEKLSAAPPKPKTPSKAPAPITPLTGAAPVATDVPTDRDDIGDWIRKRQKQVHASRR